MSEPVLSPSSLHFLAQSGNSLTINNGYRTLSFQSLRPHDTRTSKVPIHLNSHQALEFCGMQSSIAAMLYEHWLLERLQSQSSPGNLGHARPLIVLAREYIEGIAKGMNACSKEDDWNGALKGMGIKREMRDGILDPEFEHWRMKKLAREWAFKTVEETWVWLEGLEGRVQAVVGEEAERRQVRP